MTVPFRSGYPSGLTVSAVQVLLHYFWSPDMYPDLIGQQFATNVEQLTREALMTNDYKLTERGECFARAIMDLPLPTQHWRMP